MRHLHSTAVFEHLTCTQYVPISARQQSWKDFGKASHLATIHILDATHLNWVKDPIIYLPEYHLAFVM